MTEMNLRELFHIETKNEWLPPFYESQDEIDAEIAFSNWLIVRDTKQAEELDNLEYGIERYQWWCREDGKTIAEKTHRVNILKAERDELQRRIDEVNEIKYHVQGMGCGLEDIGVTDRYDAMAHGWDEAMESVGRTLNVELEADDE